MQVNLVFEGFKFMILGMSGVFSFLILTVLVLKLQGILLNRLFPESPAAVLKRNLSPERDNDENLIAVLSAAIIAFKNQKKEPK